MALDIVPITLAEANEFVKRNHRHHGKVIGHKFSIAVADVETSKIVGVAIVGRPVSRFLDDGWTLEVNRCRTDFADIQNKKECGGNRQWQNHYLRNWAANTKGKGII